MRSFKPILAVLPFEQQLLWPLLRPVRDLGFVLYGGTAVALRCGNRQSVYFDFFGPSPLEKEKLRKAPPFILEGTVIQDEINTLTILASSVKLSFFGVGVKSVSPPDLTDDGVALVASPVDLMAYKLKVILQRAEAKDYFDIAALIDNGTSIKEGINGAQTIFGKTFQPMESLKALTYFEDGDLVSLDLDTKTRLKESVENF